MNFEEIKKMCDSVGIDYRKMCDNCQHNDVEKFAYGTAYCKLDGSAQNPVSNKNNCSNWKFKN